MTQGLVTVQRGGKVGMKIITGEDGMNAHRVARAIKKLGRIPRLKEAYDLALRLGFGSSKTLVVVGEKKILPQGGRDPASPLLPKNFRQTSFQPSMETWNRGSH